MNAFRLSTSGLALALALATAPALAQTAPVEKVIPIATSTEVVAPDVIVTTPPDTVTNTDVVVITPPDVVVTTPPDVVVTTPSAPHAGAFDALPPGGQKIARALYAAQGNSSVTGSNASGTGWSMDAIAAARSQGGWGTVFKQMKADGLIAEKNLGQVVSGHQRAALPVETTTLAIPLETTGMIATVRQTPVVVSYGNSASNVVSRGSGGHTRHSVATAGGGVTAGGGKPMTGATAHGHGGGHAAAVAASAQSATIATAAGGTSHAGDKGGAKHGK